MTHRNGHGNNLLMWKSRGPEFSIPTCSQIEKRKTKIFMEHYDDIVHSAYAVVKLYNFTLNYPTSSLYDGKLWKIKPGVNAWYFAIGVVVHIQQCVILKCNCNIIYWEYYNNSESKVPPSDAVVHRWECHTIITAIPLYNIIISSI